MSCESIPCGYPFDWLHWTFAGRNLARKTTAFVDITYVHTYVHIYIILIIYRGFFHKVQCYRAFIIGCPIRRYVFSCPLYWYGYDPLDVSDKNYVTVNYFLSPGTYSVIFPAREIFYNVRYAGFLRFVFRMTNCLFIPFDNLVRACFSHVSWILR